MYNVTWELLIRRLLPQRKRTSGHINWLKAFIAPIAQLHSDFLEYRESVLYRLSINGQVINLEKLLNDKFNNGNPAYTGENIFSPGIPTGIYISDPNTYLLPHYIWNKIEDRPKTFLYNKWKPNVQYSKGEFCVYADQVYRAMMNSLNTPPDSIAGQVRWGSPKPLTYLRNKAEYESELEFIVNVPSNLFDVNTDTEKLVEMNAWINIYRAIPAQFKIVNYSI